MEQLLPNSLVLFLAQALLIVASARLLGLLGRRIGQPMVIAECVAGIVLGPSLLGWVWPGLSRALFPPESMLVLSTVSQLGVLIFMFLVGLELDPKLLRGRGRSSVLTGQASILVPFGLGAALAVYLYPRLAAPTVRLSTFLLFLGAAMSVTAFPVLASILSERRLVRTRIGAIAIACAAVDDVTAWCLLAFLVSSVRATALLGAVRTTALAALYVAAMFGVVRPLLARLAARSLGKKGLTQDLVAATLVALLLSCWITEVIGIHALFGAFLLGAILPKNDGFAATLAEKLEDLVLVFLLPLFFAISGLRTQIGLLNTGQAWMTCGLIILVACLSKFAGTALVARWTGLRWREAAAIGVLMNTRGLMALVVLNLGLDLGVISSTLFTMLVLMALVTTFLTTPVLQGIYPLAELARDLEADLEEALPLAPLRPEFTVLLCVSGEPSDPGMITLGFGLRGDNPALSRLFALRLLSPTDRATQEHNADDQGAAALAPLLARAQELSLPVRPLSFVSTQPGRDICNLAEVKRADLVLLGWHRSSPHPDSLGDTVQQVMSEAPMDVGVLYERGLTRLARVLVPYGSTPDDVAALRLARRLHQRGVAVTLLAVVASAAAVAARQQALESIAGPQFSAPQAQGFTVVVLAHSSLADAALAQAGQGYDLLVVGMGSEWGPAEGASSPAGQALVTRCRSSLLLVRGARKPQDDQRLSSRLEGRAAHAG